MKLGLHVSKCEYIGAREIQQDSCGCTDSAIYRQKGMLAVVSDGIGGMQDGEKFSRIAVDEMTKSFSASDASHPLDKRLMQAYQAARAAAQQTCEDPDDPEGGATVIAAAICDDRCTFLSVGDSRIYLLRGGELILLNREQTLGVMLDEGAAFGYISAQDAEGNTMRKSLTNHLCEARDKPADIYRDTFALQAGDRLALMSDGVFSALSEEEIRSVLRSPAPKTSAVLIDMVKQKALPKQDNSSVIVISVMNNKTTKKGGTNHDS